jgi:hypothetical protein
MRRSPLVFAALATACRSASSAPDAPIADGAAVSASANASAMGSVAPLASGSASVRVSAAIVASASSSTSVAAPRVRPQVRVQQWLCESQMCEGWPTYAYDYLPAASADGDVVAVVEERDGWGHTRTPGVRFVATSSGASAAFHPLVTGTNDVTSYAVVTARRTEFAALVDAANTALDARAWWPLLPPGEPAIELDQGNGFREASGADGCEACRVRVRWSVAGIVVTLTGRKFIGSGIPPNDADLATVAVDGKEVARARAGAWPKAPSCSTTVLEPIGVRREARVVVFTETRVLTTHFCDGIEEPRVWHSMRW